ncbi:MAG: T9SS type A sorting domain-containing protein [Bacteroidales bacterium]|nr:T9SS type A sorting domain-containing protein [Bacteroidales bacterium]
MPIRKFIIINVFFFALGLSHLHSQINALPVDKYLGINPTHFGLNGRSTEGPSWTDTGFLKLVEEIAPGIIRYPAGTQANYWNWRTGTFIEGSGKSSDFIYSIPMLTAGLPESTEVIYVMNLARPLPSTGIPLDASHEVLISDSVLQYKITDVLEALDYFKANFKFPVALELGNEFYFDSEHGTIYAANPTLYLEHSDKIIRAVKEKYPEIKILLITTKGGTTNRDFWNATIIQYLEDNADFAALVDGLVQHHYINDSYGDPTIVFDAASSITAITEALEYTQDMVADYSIVPDDFELWFTEMGATKENADETWVAGLRAFLFSIEMALLGDKVENVLYHHITEQSVINKDLMKLGSAGLSLSLLSEAAEDQSEMCKLSFEGEIGMNGIYPAIQTYVFKSDSTLNMMLMNISDQDITDINLDTVLSNNLFLSGRQYYANDPWVQGVFEENGIHEQEIFSVDGLVLKPFSLSIIKTRKQSSTLSLANIYNDIEWEVYPNPHSDYFCIEGKEELTNGNYRIFDMRGQLVEVGLLRDGVNKIYYNGNEGIYLLILNTNEQNSVYKLIKSIH